MKKSDARKKTEKNEKNTKKTQNEKNGFFHNPTHVTAVELSHKMNDQKV